MGCVRRSRSRSRHCGTAARAHWRGPHSGFVRRACDGARARTTRWFGFFRRLGQLSLLRRGRGRQGKVRLQRPRPPPTADRSRVFSARRLPLRRPRQVRRTRSARRPTPSVRSDLCVGARSPSHFLAVTGLSSTRPPPKGPGEPMIAAAVRRPDPVCPRRFSAAAVHLCMCRGAPQSEAIPSLALRWQASASRKSLFAGTSASSAKVPAPHSPMLQPPGDAEGLGFRGGAADATPAALQAARVRRRVHIARAHTHCHAHAHTRPHAGRSLEVRRRVERD